MELLEFVNHFENPKRQADGSYMVRCPCHDDDKQSLHISKKSERILLHDHGCCDWRDIIRAVGLSESDLFLNSKPSLTWRDRMEYGFRKKYGEGVHIVDVYDYTDAKGKYLFSKIRIEGGSIKGKEFIQARIDYASDSYRYGLGDTKPTLYNLPSLIRSIREGFPIYFVEGEKDVKTMSRFHYTATTAGAAGGWKKEYAKYFIGAVVNILPDNDEAGEKLAKEVARDLKQYAFEVRVVPKISQLKKGDVTDYFEKEEGTIEAFKAKVSSTVGLLAPWAYLNSRDEINIKPSQLAVSFSKAMDYIIVRNPLDDNDLFYGFEDGVYRRWNRAQVKSALRKFVPVTYQRDSQITEAYRTIFELGKKIHSFDELDNDERYINFRNGLYDVRARKLIPHDPTVLSTMQLQFDYELTAANHPVFDRYLNDLFTCENGTVDNTSKLIIQEFGGLVLSNIAVYRTKKALFLCSTCGNTGKTVLLNLIQYLLGEENCTSIPIQHMNEQSGRFTMGTALGRRLIVNGDQTESDVTDSSYFKELVGGDRVKMEMKNQKPLMVRYRGGIAVGCNGMPSFSDDKGSHVFERLLLIMCTHTIPEDKRDSMMLDKLKAEAQAIILWFLEGLHRLIDNGFKFTKSERMDQSLKEYRSQLDTVYRFIQEGAIVPPMVERHSDYRTYYTITGDRADQVKKNDFYQNYSDWCQSSDIDVTPIKKKNLNQRLEGLGLEVDRKGFVGDQRGIYTIRGMKIVNEVTGDGRAPTKEEIEVFKAKKAENHTDTKVRISRPKSPHGFENMDDDASPFD